MLKLWLSRIGYLSFLILAFGAGWLVEWYNSPLGPPLCAFSGAAYVARIINGWPYWTGWALIGGVCVVVVAVPLYGIWREMRKGGCNVSGK